MGRDASKAVGNVWREARLEAAKYDETLFSRERVAELLGIGIDAVRRIETNANKTMPVDTAVLMADLYNAPELENYYCLHECPIGCRKALSCEVPSIERVTINLLNRANSEKIADLKEKLLNIADDGKITDDEVEEVQDLLNSIDDISKSLSELKTIARKALKGVQSDE